MGSVNDYDPARLNFALESQQKRKLEFRRPWLPDCEFEDFVDRGHNCHTIIQNTIRGKDCVIKSGSVIGEKGFSFGFDEKLVPHEIVHTGGVKIGDRVEIGANCTVARATLAGKYTEICDDVKIDDQVHVGHNCYIGERTIITACVEISGSVKIGQEVWIGPNASIMEGVMIGDRALIGIGAVVLKDVPACAVMVGNPARLLRYRA